MTARRSETARRGRVEFLHVCFTTRTSSKHNPDTAAHQKTRVFAFSMSREAYYKPSKDGSSPGAGFSRAKSRTDDVMRL